MSTQPQYRETPGESIAVGGFTETAACPICSSTNYSVVRPAAYPQALNEEALLGIYCSSSDHALMDQLVQCSGCDLVYLNPRVRKDIALRSYSEAVDPTFVKQNDLRIKTFARSIRKFCSAVNIKPDKSLRVLDVGCAGGAFVKAATDAGFSAIGVEPSKWMVDWGKSHYNLDLRAGLVEDQGFEDQSFDVVSLWDVLEHLYNPVEVLEVCTRLLKPGGYMIINYPDYGSFACKLLGKKWPFFLSVHLFYFTPKTVTKLLKKVGLDVLSIRPFFQTLELSYVFQRGTPYLPPLSALNSLCNKIGIGSVPFTYNMGQTMVVARRR